MATAIETNRPPNASVICSVTPESLTVTPLSLPSAFSWSMAFWISMETAPVSLLVGSAETVEAGD